MPKLIENIRGKIITEGREMLVKSNYKAFSIRELAKKCDIGLGTLYNYFSNKDELLNEIFSDDWNRTLELADSLIHSDISFKDKLEGIYKSFETFIGSYMSIFYEITYESKGKKTCPHNVHSEIYKKIEKLIESEKAKGNIKSGMDSMKLSIFIVSNMFNCIKNRYMTFDELFGCINLD